MQWRPAGANDYANDDALAKPICAVQMRFVIGANTCCAMQVTFLLVGERQVADPAHVTPREFAGKLDNLDKYIF